MITIQITGVRNWLKRDLEITSLRNELKTPFQALQAFQLQALQAFQLQALQAFQLQAFHSPGSIGFYSMCVKCVHFLKKYRMKFVLFCFCLYSTLLFPLWSQGVFTLVNRETLLEPRSKFRSEALPVFTLSFPGFEPTTHYIQIVSSYHLATADSFVSLIPFCHRAFPKSDQVSDGPAAERTITHSASCAADQ